MGYRRVWNLPDRDFIRSCASPNPPDRKLFHVGAIPTLRNRVPTGVEDLRTFRNAKFTGLEAIRTFRKGFPFHEILIPNPPDGVPFHVEDLRKVSEPEFMHVEAIRRVLGPDFTGLPLERPPLVFSFWPWNHSGGVIPNLNTPCLGRGAKRLARTGAPEPGGGGDGEVFTRREETEKAGGNWVGKEPARLANRGEKACFGSPPIAIPPKPLRPKQSPARPCADNKTVAPWPRAVKGGSLCTPAGSSSFGDLRPWP
jgi:hypothetical protein